MALPAFSTPNALQLRPLQQALDTIREGLKVLDARLQAVAAQAGQTSLIQGQSGSTSTSLLTQIASFQAAVVEATAAASNTLPKQVAFATGPMTVSSGHALIMSKQLQLVGIQRLSLTGNSRLRIS